MNTDSAKELRECPFCGGEGAFEGVGQNVIVRCQRKDCPIYAKWFTPGEWNRRAPAVEAMPSAESVEALAAVDDLSDGSRHDWRKFAHDLAAELRRVYGLLEER